MKKLKAIAIITARGGSKRIPHKNIKNFCGKPIIHYSIEAALNSKKFDIVMVSTDSQKISELSKHMGAECPFLRSRENSDDFATTSDVLVEVLESYKLKGITFEYVCCIYPTAPFVSAEKISMAMNKLISDSSLDAVVPIVQYSFPPQRAFKVQNSEVSIIFPEYFPMRSQDLEPIFHDCGQYYCMRVSSFLKEQSLVLEHTLPIMTPETEVQDIDTLEDWALAEIKYQQIKNRE